MQRHRTPGSVGQLNFPEQVSVQQSLRLTYEYVYKVVSRASRSPKKKKNRLARETSVQGTRSLAELRMRTVQEMFREY